MKEAKGLQLVEKLGAVKAGGGDRGGVDCGEQEQADECTV